jgi:DNA-nicking Smr family endonuclease
MSSKKSDNDKSNQPESFLEMMDGVTPLTQNKIDPDATPKPKLPRRSTTREAETNEHSSLGELQNVTPVSADEVLSYVSGGIQQKLMVKLKKGLYPFEGKIDLHGATVRQAGKELDLAINDAYTHGLRCILVVHGRGKGSLDNKPALKTHVNQWLRELPQVLAFHSAQSRHGGTGALYVLLKRQRGN